MDGLPHQQRNHRRAQMRPYDVDDGVGRLLAGRLPFSGIR